jgi:hypothetical protein
LALGQAHDLYSARARRLVRTMLQLRLLELREERLDRVRAVIERNLGPDALLAPDPPGPGSRASDR